MKQNLSLVERFFAPTPIKVVKVIIGLLLLSGLCFGYYVFRLEVWAKYVGMFLLAVGAFLQFRVDRVAYALDGLDFEKKSNDFDFFENLDLNTATIKQLYDARYYWSELLRNWLTSTYPDYDKARAKLAEVKAKIHTLRQITATHGTTPVKSTNRDPKTGKFLKKDA